MSTRTIAVDSEVYRKLHRLKRESESFSRVIDRLVESTGRAHTGAEILRRLAEQPPLSAADARRMSKAVADHRKRERWVLHDLS
jgi:predicted CopG family antitoxin